MKTYKATEVNDYIAEKPYLMALTGGADCEQSLHGVEEEEHDEQRHGGTDGQTQRLEGVERLHVCGGITATAEDSLNPAALIKFISRKSSIVIQKKVKLS